MDFTASPSRLFQPSKTYKPFHYPKAVDITIEHERVHWIEQEVELADDVEDWKSGRLADHEKNFITQILRLFTQSDVNVGEFYKKVLETRIENNEVSLMTTAFRGREGTHQRAYSLVQETLGLPESEYHAFLSYKAMADKHEHMLDADASTVPGLMLAIVKAICNEGICLFGSFAMLLTFQRDGKMRGMGKAVEWSQRDETIHVQGLSYLLYCLCTEHPELVTDSFKLACYDMVRQTVELEDLFIDLAFEMGAIGDLTPDVVKLYVRYIADRRLVQIGLKENWAIEENPLPWIDTVVGAEDHTNFFEGKSTEYEVGALTGEWVAHSGPTAATYLVAFKDGCPHCVDAKALLRLRGLPFATLDLTDDKARDAFYASHGFSGTKGIRAATMPKVFETVQIAGRKSVALIGGSSDLSAFLEPAAH